MWTFGPRFEDWGHVKKILSLLASFVLGFVFFMGGAAVATNSIGSNTQDQVSEDQVSQDQSVNSPDSSGQTANQGPSPSGDTYCFEIGKANELGGDCFCVKDDVSDMAEVDCLIASGIVPASSRAGYLQELESRATGTDSGSSSGPSRTGPSGDTYCFEIGKDNELGGDCFCVKDDVSDMAEVDCLIASGIVPAETREDYRRYLGLPASNP